MPAISSPLRVGDLAIRIYPEQPVGVCDGVEVGILAIQEERVRFPDLVQHLGAGPQLGDIVQRSELQSAVSPVLPEVAVHGKHLNGNTPHELLNRCEYKLYLDPPCCPVLVLDWAKGCQRVPLSTCICLYYS